VNTCCPHLRSGSHTHTGLQTIFLVAVKSSTSKQNKLTRIWCKESCKLLQHEELCNISAQKDSNYFFESNFGQYLLLNKLKKKNSKNFQLRMKEEMIEGRYLKMINGKIV